MPTKGKVEAITYHDSKGVVIEAGDYIIIEVNMGKCSTWLPGHDKAPRISTPFPKPEEVLQNILDLESWVKAVRSRVRS